MTAVVHCIGKINRRGESSINTDWEEIIQGYCQKLGIDISWFVNLENYRSEQKPDFIIWRSSKFSSEDRQKMNELLSLVTSPVVVFSYIDPKGMPTIYKRIEKISFENKVSAIFCVTYDLKEFLNQLKKIDKILHLRWF